MFLKFSVPPWIFNLSLKFSRGIAERLPLCMFLWQPSGKFARGLPQLLKVLPKGGGDPLANSQRVLATLLQIELLTVVLPEGCQYPLRNLLEGCHNPVAICQRVLNTLWCCCQRVLTTLLNNLQEGCHKNMHRGNLSAIPLENFKLKLKIQGGTENFKNTWRHFSFF